MTEQTNVTPATSLAAMIGGFSISQAIFAAAELKIADLLRDGPRTAGDLAADAKVHSKALFRLLRALASVGIFAEDPAGRFGLTPMADCLRSDGVNSLRPWALLAGQDCVRRPWSRILDSISNNKPTFSAVFETSAFEYLELNPDAASLFQQSMTNGTNQWLPAILKALDFSAVSLLVDVGGGVGTFLKCVLKSFPHMRGILFDRPAVIETARTSLAAEHMEVRCECIGGDFFNTVPCGGDLYILKWIVHDFDDVRAEEVLKACRRSMRGSSKLILIECVVPSGNTPSASKIGDLNMLVLHGGCERTAPEFRALLDSAGFALLGITPTDCPLHIIEAIPN